MNLRAILGLKSAEQKRGEWTAELERLRKQRDDGKPSAISIRDASLTSDQLKARIETLERKLGLAS